MNIASFVYRPTKAERYWSIVGFIAIVVFYWAVTFNCTKNGTYDFRLFPESLFTVTCWFWLITTIVGKLSVVCGHKIIYLFNCAVGSLVVILMISSSVKTIVPFEGSILYDYLGLAGLLCNIFVDLWIVWSHYFDKKA